MAFSDIASRANGQRILYSWFNSLRDSGIALEEDVADVMSFLGTNVIPETSFALANNQSSAANVMGLVFSSASNKGAVIFAEIRRSTGSSEVIALGKISAIYRAATTAWELIETWDGDDTGITLSITTGGQVQYTSTNLAGTGYAGTIRFKAIPFGV